MVIVSTPTAVKVAGVTSWIHHTQGKEAKATDVTAKWTVSQTMDLLKLRFHQALEPSIPCFSTSS